jgi:uncharacterized damage-inducible protein DinB
MILKQFTSAVLFCAAVTPLLTIAQEHQAPFIEDFLSKWENARIYTIEFAESMPAEKYDFKPTDEQRGFNEQLTHMCGNMIWLSTAFLDGKGLAAADEEHPPTEKEEILILLQETFDYVAETVRAFDYSTIDNEVDFFAGPMTKRRIFFLLADHLTHHRGQLADYLRLNDITPPRYRGW